MTFGCLPNLKNSLITAGFSESEREGRKEPKILSDLGGVSVALLPLRNVFVESIK